MLPRIIRIVSLTLIICSLPTFSLSGSQVTASQKSSSQSFRVMTYNIRAADYGINGIIATLQEAKADIIALQEVDKLVKRTGKIDQPEKIARSLGMNCVFRKHFSYQGGEFGLALLSRYKIDHVERVRVRRSNLILLKARVHTPGYPVNVIVVHFHPTNPLDKATTKKENDAARLREAKRAFEIATIHDTPFLIMGDFNANSGSPAYGLFSEKFQDCCRVAGGLWGKTWPAKFPITRIDYIWVSRHFKVLRCRTLGRRASDHLPVMAEIQQMTVLNQKPFKCGEKQ
jgi:endonuclease/exonuclease/phosphatase family metal-dependent hydrolase